MPEKSMGVLPTAKRNETIGEHGRGTSKMSNCGSISIDCRNRSEPPIGFL
jgi:hypothetical protein